ncbi:MAG: SPOR domain-containing protein [Paludibacteraceae bacterium]|nr:SPOR domain-containing protein [Paludibacteraceae bacterium]
MKQILVLTTTLLLCLATYAERIGSVSLNQPAGLDSLVYKNIGATVQPANQVVSCSGFRVQIFSSNRGQNAKNAAFEMEKTYTEAFPESHAYVTYSAPFWKVRVGDFVSYYEALVFSNTVKDAFPDRATEIFVVKEDIVKPLYLGVENTPTIKEEETINN